MSWHDAALADLRRDGIARLPQRMDEVSAFVDYLGQRPAWNAHVKVYATEPPMRAAEAPWPAFCHDMIDVVSAPGLFEIALSFIDLAREYFDGEQPRLYSMNAFWTQPAPDRPRYLDTHDWHRDGDDRRQLVLFMFGTDVECRDDGAHLYQRGTHRIPDHALGRHYGHPPDAVVEAMTGAAGSLFLADTGGLHMGLRPGLRRRLIAWARFGVSNPPASYTWDKLYPVPRDVIGTRYPTDSALQEAVRLVVQ